MNKYKEKLLLNRKIVFSLGISLGLILGQKITMNLYDVKTLEKKSLELAYISYLTGCSDPRERSFSKCMNYSKNYVDNIEKLWQNELWRK